MEIKDYMNSIHRYEISIKRLANNELLPKKNRILAVKWIERHKKELDERYHNPEERRQNEHRTAKTLQHYCSLLTNICFWFKDLEKIDEEELKQFRKDFFELEGKKKDILSVTGKKLKSSREYLTKIIRSDFFKNYLGKEDIVKKVFNGKIRDKKGSAEFIDLTDLEKMIEVTPYNYQKIILYVLFSTGVRIGTYLNLKKRDFEIKYNPKTKVKYYLCHIKKEYTKSKEDRTVPIIISECNELLTKCLVNLKEEDYLTTLSYSGIRSLLEKVTGEAKVKTKPSGRKPYIHLIRKSTAMFLLNSGYSLDQVKAFLGHSPSSTAIDVYVNYVGLKFEPEVTRIQTDELINLKETIKENELGMNILSQKVEKLEKSNKAFMKFIKKFKAS